jgi:hypothetical protein
MKQVIDAERKRYMKNAQLEEEMHRIRQKSKLIFPE